MHPLFGPEAGEAKVPIPGLRSQEREEGGDGDPEAGLPRSSRLKESQDRPPHPGDRTWKQGTNGRIVKDRVP